ncbi:MAG TPA: hypothetical protein VM818_07535 [Vicinamibacterales bacterium]|jgi:hypothetical protein|nr:hypothetical protein [Vicinamibacterales bacterium]
MEPSLLRYAILQLLQQHEATGSSAFLDDTVMAERLNVPLLHVQRQLVILEDHELVALASAFGPSHTAELTPKGMEALEAAAAIAPGDSRKIGF